MERENEVVYFTDVTGVPLTASLGGERCLGNGEHVDGTGALIECCCDNCDYALLCFPEWAFSTGGQL